MELSLKDRLVKYLQNNHGWIASGTLQRIVAEKTTYTPRTTCRRLEELVNNNKLEVQYRKGHAWYRATQPNQFSQPTKMVKSPQEVEREMINYFNSLPECV